MMNTSDVSVSELKSAHLGAKEIEPEALSAGEATTLPHPVVTFPGPVPDER